MLIAALALGAWASPACKSNEVHQSTSTTNNFMTVGDKGATVPGPDNTSVVIPPGALSGDTQIGIAVAQDGDYQPPPAGTAFTSKVYAFLPHGQFFALDATIVLPATLANHDVWHSEEGEGWTKLARAKANDGFVRVRASAFSFFALSDAVGPEPVDGGTKDSSTVGPDGSGAGDAAVPPDTSPVVDTSTCTPSCPSGPLSNEQPCMACGSGQPCVSMVGSTEYNCRCEPSGGDYGTLVMCKTSSAPPDTGVTDTASGGTDTAVTDTGGGAAVCGDGVVTSPAENCDDGNNLASDGCSSTCRVESGWICPDAGAACEPA